MMVSSANFLLFSHTVPAHLTAKSVIPYYSLVSPVTIGERALPADVLSEKDLFSVETPWTITIIFVQMCQHHVQVHVMGHVTHRWSHDHLRASSLDRGVLG